jgi:3-oxoacyl-[acyl-carrier protein] reductase
MGDPYTSFARSGLGKTVVKRLGLPDPPKLERWHEGWERGPVRLGPDTSPRHAELAGLLSPTSAERYYGLVFDATGLREPEDLRALYEFFHPLARCVMPSGRVIIVGSTEENAAQRALDGFIRSVGKEFGRGIAAQLIRLHPEAAIESARSTLDFFLSPKSAYVSGQTITVGPGTPKTGATQTVLVTGAARGIGAAMARVLARDGAHVICLDVPSQGQDLMKIANLVRGEALQLDLTAPDAAGRLVDFVRERHHGLDVIVHNAGITRDKTLAKMDAPRWDSVLGVNLIAPAQVTRALLEADLIRRGVIGVSSIAGLAGNRGQTNYATSKAGVIGWIHELAGQLAPKGITANAVAPGFIETAMTAKMPFFVRETGRRLNSMSQGGLPLDVAETVAWLSNPASAAVTGNIVRVCGQMLLGA